jgi:hypothetical protein
MMRSFLTRLVDSATWVFLLIPCLLLCLACATPFPFDRLEEGMTVEFVVENFGAPDAIYTKPGSMQSWSYVHEEQSWVMTALTSSILLPLCIFISAVTMPFGEEHWCAGSNVEEHVAVLDFEAWKLTRWWHFYAPRPIPPLVNPWIHGHSPSCSWNPGVPGCSWWP